MKATPKQPLRKIHTNYGDGVVVDFRDRGTEDPKELYPTVGKVEFAHLRINGKDYENITFYIDRTPYGGRVTESNGWGSGGLTPKAAQKIWHELEPVQELFPELLAPLDPGDLARARMSELQDKLEYQLYQLARDYSDEELDEALRRIADRRFGPRGERGIHPRRSYHEIWQEN